MWTPTVYVPSSLALIDSASSRSFAVGGSIVKILSPRRSFLISYSRSGMLLGYVSLHADCPDAGAHLQGSGGKHLRATSANSSVGKLQSFSRALVSTSQFPIGPSSSTSVPNGWREVLIN